MAYTAQQTTDNTLCAAGDTMPLDAGETSNRSTSENGLTIKEASERLASSREWVYRLIRDGRVHIIKEGGPGYHKGARVSRDDIEREREARVEKLERKLRQTRAP